MGADIFTLPIDNGGRYAYHTVMQHGSTQLLGWQRRQKLNQREAAKKLGLHYTSYNQLLSRRRVPGRQKAVEIEALTGVPVCAWTPTTVGKNRKRQLRKRENEEYLQGANA